MSQGNKDKYTCYQCGHSVITIQREQGMTPIFMDCRGLTCDGVMYSHMKNKLDVMGKSPEVEWRFPTDEEQQNLTKEERNRVNNKGLLLYPIKETVE